MRVLVVYGSSRGGTAGLAQMVAEAFVAQGVLADIGDAADIDDIADYDAVVLGGALYNGRWHSDATWFVERNLDALRQAQVWFFSSGPLDDSARSGALAPVEQVQDLARRADIRGHMTFGGVLEKRASRWLSSLLAWGRPGDFRDRQHVDEWVGRIVTRLGEPQPEITVPATNESVAPPPKRVLRRLSHSRVDGDDHADDDGAYIDSADDDLGLDVLTDS